MTQSVSKSLLQEYNKLMHDQWAFLFEQWPQIPKSKFHQTEMKTVNDIEHVKDTVLQQLGYIPVFFFLTVLFAIQDYPGPYHNCEKGLLILYQLVKNCSMEQMGRFILRRSFYDIYRCFYIKQSQTLDKKLSLYLASTVTQKTLTMFYKFDSRAIYLMKKISKNYQKIFQNR